MNIDTYLEYLQDIDEDASLFRQKVDDCSMGEFRIMDMVAKDPKLCLQDIGLERNVCQQGIGRIAKRLHEKGFVEVVRNERDARTKHLILTEKGRQVRSKCRGILEEIIQ